MRRVTASGLRGPPRPLLPPPLSARPPSPRKAPAPRPAPTQQPGGGRAELSISAAGPPSFQTLGGVPSQRRAGPFVAPPLSPFSFSLGSPKSPRRTFSKSRPRFRRTRGSMKTDPPLTPPQSAAQHLSPPRPGSPEGAPRPAKSRGAEGEGRGSLNSSLPPSELAPLQTSHRGEVSSAPVCTSSQKQSRRNLDLKIYIYFSAFDF